jgi:hypothetical protein
MTCKFCEEVRRQAMILEEWVRSRRPNRDNSEVDRYYREKYQAAEESVNGHNNSNQT